MLKKYTKSDFKLLQQWIKDEEILLQFSGPDWQFPLKEEDLEAQYKKFPYRQFYIGYTDNNEPYAFGQIIAKENNAPRLGRLLIGDENKRGKGLGQKFIAELITECRLIYPSDVIHLFVYENNLQAIGCYKKLGFEFNDDTQFSLTRNGKELKILKMTLNLLP